MKAKRGCNVADCQEPHLAKGYCYAHYWRNWRYGNPLQEKSSRCPKIITTQEGETRQCKHRATHESGLCGNHRSHPDYVYFRAIKAQTGA